MKFLSTTILTATLSILATGQSMAETKKTEKSEKKAQPVVDYSKKKYPMGFAHGKGQVISPFFPYNILNVSHLRPGDLARDPTTAKVNPTTRKADLSTAKIFRVPPPKKSKPTN